MKGILGVVIAIAVVAAGAFYALSAANPEGGASSDAIAVATTSYIATEFTERIGGDAVEIVASPGVGVGVHDYEPTAREVQAVIDSDLFIMNGEMLDAWADNTAVDAEENGVEVLTLTEHVTLLPFEEHADEHDHDDEHGHDDHADEEKEDEHAHDEHGDEDHDEEHADEHEDEEGHDDEHGHEDEDAHDHAHGEYDPHIWLDVSNAISIAEEIAEALSEIDADNADTYNENAAALIAELEELDESFEQGLASCELNDVVVMHDAFGYMADAYGFDVISVSGINPEGEPSPARLAEVSDLVEERGITTVFFETAASPRVAETIAAETGAEVDLLNPIESISSDEQDAGESYVSLMQANLAALQGAMNCQ